MIAVAACAVIGTGFFLSMRDQPLFADALYYVKAAQSIADSGLLSPWIEAAQRTYGYPAFIALGVALSDTTNLPLDAVIFVAQLLIYVGACLFLVWTLSPRFGSSISLLLFLLLANPVILAYVPVPLTESLTISLFLVVVGVITLAARAQSLRNCGLLLAVAAATTSYLVELRPASVVVVPGLLLAVPAVLGRAKPSWSSRPWHRSAAAGFALLALLPPLALEAIINIHNYSRLSIFPVADASRVAFSGGSRYLKYATNMSGNGQYELFYDNPFRGQASAPDLSFYYHEPLKALPTMVLHDFNSLNPDFLFPYIHNLHPMYQLPLVAGIALLVCVGFWGAFCSLRDLLQRRATTLTALPLPAAVFLLAALGCNLALNSVIQVETRYGFVSLASLTIFAFLAIYQLRASSRSAKVKIASAAVLYMVVAVALNAWVLGQAPLLQSYA